VDGVTKTVLSTRDLSRIFRVNESSVKRWADLGVLHCFRTPGGHRKFTPEEVARFARDQQFVLDEAALRLLGAAGRFARTAGPRELDALGDDLLEALTSDDPDSASRMLLEAHASHLPLGVLLDAVVQRTHARLGERRAAGLIEPYRERIASAALVEALVRLGDSVGRGSALPLHAVLGCLPGETDDVRLRCLQVFLVQRGWKVTYLGGSLPEGALETAVRRIRPHAVFVSASTGGDGARAHLDSVARAAGEVGARLVVGGLALEPLAAALPPGVDFAARGVAEVEPLVEEMARRSGAAS
jgi:hypothetical protein